MAHIGCYLVVMETPGGTRAQEPAATSHQQGTSLPAGKQQRHRRQMKAGYQQRYRGRDRSEPARQDRRIWLTEVTGRNRVELAEVAGLTQVTGQSRLTLAEVTGQRERTDEGTLNSEGTLAKIKQYILHAPCTCMSEAPWVNRRRAE